ncbi:c1027130-4971-4ff8-b58f-f9b2f8e4fced-CDS [Sclerotinia trifoliorum]|uniref:C1027130-4971-4ff8-b58f-f9b2f8e4fced-CDS n=1 Tax=Sclerotinia trifoliorum TaxID=28548 RepID=A0A8H2ZPM2_9HELO|nr:c1027130-4971-4ff8-b58f-f9b2f8e4fced-CDS [Sclerotinia trifoliorum]
MNVIKLSMGYNQALSLEQVVEIAIANYTRNRATGALQTQHGSYFGQGYSFERRHVEGDNDVDVFPLPECEMPACGGFCHLYFPASGSIEETRKPEGFLGAREDKREGGTARSLRETLRSEPSMSSSDQLNVDSAYSSWHGSQNMDSDKEEDLEFGWRKADEKEDEEDGEESVEEKEEGESEEEKNGKERRLTRRRGGSHRFWLDSATIQDRIARARSEFLELPSEFAFWAGNTVFDLPNAVQ